MSANRLAIDAMAMAPPMTGVPTVIAEIARALVTHAPEIETRVFRPFEKMPRLLRVACEQFVLPVFLLARRPRVLLAPAYVAPLLAPCETWLVIHDLHVFTHPETCSLLNRWHYRMLIPPSLRKAKRVFVLSRHTRDILLARFPHVADKVEVLPVGIPRDMTYVPDVARRAACHERYGLPEKFFLFVGSLHPRKNLPRLMEAVSRLPEDAALVMVGAASRDAARVLKNIRANPRRFTWLGFVPQDDMACLYSSTHALVLPSLDEGLGLPVLEAMACYCPVLAALGPAQEFFPEAPMCDPLSTDSIERELRRLWQDDTFCHELSGQAARHAEKLSWRETARFITGRLA
ncbi:MAG: glycosyltransferase family 4 protein [Kiritimatiellaeota bacterium]|nr:glycosyltransferase family 4 protein [Kiritimatiellota bacterium]